MRTLYTITLLSTLSMVGCVVDSGKAVIKIPTTSTQKAGATIANAHITSVQIINSQLVINGSGLGVVKQVKIDGNSLNENFTIESQTSTKIVANALKAISFDVSKVFGLILSDANASATFPIDFSICNSTLNGKSFNCAVTAGDKDVLSYDATTQTWKPRPASGLNYLGTFDASSNPGAGPATAPAGSYYIISDSGTVATISFSVGDWIVSNGTGWQKIDNSVTILSVFNRTGSVVAQKGDYDLNKLGDVDLSVAPTNGKVLKYDGTSWVAADDLTGGGAGSVTTTSIANSAVTDAKIDTVSASKITGTITSTQILDGTILNADINAAAAIDYSKLSVPDSAIPYVKLNIGNTTIPYAKLNIADGDIPVAKVSGIPAVTSVLTTSITNGDTTHAPNGDAVYDALGLKLNLSGGALTAGATITGLPSLPMAGSEATSKDYVDSVVSGAAPGANELVKVGTFDGFSSNIYVGLAVGNSGTATGTSNEAFGDRALQSLTSGVRNVAFGILSLFRVTTGDSNIGIGQESGSNITTGSNNIAIGNYSTVPTATASNQISIGNLIYGTNGTSVGIGEVAPAATLDVKGTIKSVAATNSGTTIDFSTGNLQYTSANCTTGVNLNNMKSGATYTLAFQGTTGGTCTFNAYTGNGSGALTLKSGTVSLVQSANKHALFTFIVMGSYVYVAAIDGY